MTHKKPRKHGKLRALYEQDEEARKFLEKHPELDNMQCEEESDYYDFNHRNLKKGRYQLEDIDEADYKYQRSEKLREALSHYPDSYLKEVMTRYYAGDSISELHEFMGVNNRKTVFEYISRAKRKLDRWFKAYKTRRINPEKSIVIAEKRLVYGKTGKEQRVFLRYDEYCDDYVWTHSNGWVLPEEVQKILDEDPEFASWDDTII